MLREDQGSMGEEVRSQRSHNSYQINEPVEIGGVGLCFRPFASTTLRRIV